MKNIVLILGIISISTSWVHAQELSEEEINQPRPIEALDTVFIEKMTWLEVRDAIKEGKTTAIIATGGIEQNGPYLALDKHNVILGVLANKIARSLGNALVAPIVGFVPEGNFSPPSGHMRYPGTIGVSQETFKALLIDIAKSLKVHGFKNIILLGDSGGNRMGMAEVTDDLNKMWKAENVRLHYIPEYYDNPLWQKWLQEKGVPFEDEGIHDDFRHSGIMMLADPDSVRIKQREKAELTSINGHDLLPLENSLKIANELVDFQTEITVTAIKKSIGER